MPTARITRPSRTKSPTRNSDHVNCLRCAIRNLLRAAPELEERTASEGGHYKSRPKAKPWRPQEHSLKSGKQPTITCPCSIRMAVATQEHRLKSVLLECVLPDATRAWPTNLLGQLYKIQIKKRCRYGSLEARISSGLPSK